MMQLHIGSGGAGRRCCPWFRNWLAAAGSVNAGRHAVIAAAAVDPSPRPATIAS
jgi:hypothetical protein